MAEPQPFEETPPEMVDLATKNTTPSTPKPKTFKDLPVEIRLQIWRLAVVPRLVEFHIPKIWNRHWLEDYYNKSIGIIESLTRLRETLLPLLIVNYESNEEIRRLYPKMFGVECYDDASSKIQKTAGISFNPEIDTLMFNFHHYLEYFLLSHRLEGLREVKRVAIRWYCWNKKAVKNFNFQGLCVLFLACPNVERLCLIWLTEAERRKLTHKKEREWSVADLNTILWNYFDLFMERDEGRRLWNHRSETFLEMFGNVSEEERMEKVSERFRKVASVMCLEEFKTESGVE